MKPQQNPPSTTTTTIFSDAKPELSMHLKRPRKPSPSPPLATASSPMVDFRAPVGDAWYGASVAAEEGGAVLRVMYCNFPESFDDWFFANSFKDLKELEEFEGRFRVASVQAQDSDCGRIIEGVVVCASHNFGEEDLRFYDAVIESVHYSNHKLVNGESECSCAFMVLWKHGPMEGEKTFVGIESICLLHPKRGLPCNQALCNFLDALGKRFGPGSMSKVQSPNHPFELSKDETKLARCDASTFSRLTICSVRSGSSGPLGSKKHRDTATNIQEVDASKQTDNLTYKVDAAQILSDMELCDSGEINMHEIQRSRKSSNSTKLGQDIHLGSELCLDDKSVQNSTYYYILIENLQKDLSSLTLGEFIYQHTLVSSQAFVLSTLSAESYTRAAIFSESKEKAEKIYDFLCDPAYIIMSSRGRPWIVGDKKCWFGSTKSEMPKFEKSPWSKTNISNKIRLARMGTKEYEKGKTLLELFMEFHDHLHGLYKRLAFEESKLMME